MTSAMIVLRPPLLLLVLFAGCTEPARAPAEKEAPESPAGPASVAMSPEAIQAAGLTIERVAMGTLGVRDEVPGTIEAPSDGLAIVNTRVAGVVDDLAVDVGDRVKAGQRIATVRSVELAETQAALKHAALAEKFAASALERAEALRAQGVLSERRVEADRLEAGQKKLALQEVTDRVRLLGGVPGGSGGAIALASPIAGVVSTRTASRGQALEAGAPIVTVVDAARVVVQLRALGGTEVKIGAEVPFTVEALRGRSFTATIKSASDLLDPETRRFFVRCTVDNADGALKPGMFLTAALLRHEVRALLVPENAIQLLPEGPSVFVALEGGRFERRTVVPGARADGRVAIEKGLREGESVVVEGAFWVRTQLQKSELEE